MENQGNKILPRRGPCLDKKCSWCCNPVKIRLGKGIDPGVIPIPKNEKGEELFKKRVEVLVPEDHPDTIRVHTFDCVNFNSETGLCEDYENRPDICRNTSCVSEQSKKSIDEQHKNLTETRFWEMK